MAKYRVQGPDGAVHVFEGPDGATQDQILAFAQQHFGPANAPADVSQKPAEVAHADDPGAMMSALIAAGWTTDRVLKGMQQLYYGAKSKLEPHTLGSLVTGEKPADRELRLLDDQAKEDERLYKPLQEQHPIATALGEAAPSMVIPAGGGVGLAGTVARLAAAGAIPGALEYGTAGERAGRAAGGAAAGVAGGVVLPKVISAAVNAVPAIGRTAKAVVEPFTDSGRSAIAGRALNKAAGDDALQAAANLRAAVPVVPGSMPTAGQVAENGGLAALERAAAATNPAAFTTRSMEQAAARAKALQTVAGDPAQREFYSAARQGAAKDLYDKAFSVPIEPENLSPAMRGEVTKLMQIPAVQYALKSARENAANHGMTMESMDGSIAGLHHAKLAMDDMISSLQGATGAQANKARAIEAARDRLVTFMEKMSPDYGEARTTYAAMSKPINQMDVGKTLMDKVLPAITDHGGLARENANAYTQALRNGDQIVKQATGRDMNFADVMDPAQIDTLNAVARDLARKANAQDLGRGAGSDTTQKLLLQNLVQGNVAERSGAPKLIAALPAVAGTVAGGVAGGIPGAIAGAGAGFGLGKVAKAIYGTQEEKIVGKIADALLDPSTAATLMTANPLRPQVQTSQLLFANPGRAAQLTGGAAGFTGANLFAQ